MSDKEIGIIGGGLAGLSAAYYLSEKGFETTVFEKDSVLGGRAPNSNQIATPAYTDLFKLVEDLGIRDEVLVEMGPSDMKSYIDGSMRGFGAFKLLLKDEEDLSFVEKYIKRPLFSKLMGMDVDKIEELKEDLEEYDFSYEGRSEEVKELHDMSMEEWLEDYSDSLKNTLFYPILLILFVDDFDEVNAEDGVFRAKDFIEAMSDTIYEVSGGPLAITREIKEGISGEFNMLCEAKDVEETSDSVKVTYEKDGGEVEEEFDSVVVATTLDVSGELLGHDFGIDYSVTNAITVDGELKSSCRSMLGADPETNLRLLFAPGKEHYIHPENIDKAMDLDKFYDSYEVLGGEKTPAFPILSPGLEVPDLEFSDRIFLAGDFYYLTGLNTAVYTGRKVSELIEEKL